MMTDAREYFQIDVVFVLIGVYAILGLTSILDRPVPRSATAHLEEGI